jgi:hypothetical protein
MTPSTLSGTPRGTDTLPRDAASSEPNVKKGLLAVAGSLLLIVGVPLALVLLVGNPLPMSRPTTEWLRADVTPELVIDVLAVLVWVVWVHFAVCFLSEWRALRAGRMPAHVIGGGGSQLLARRLVAGILMLSGGVSIAHGLATAVTAPEPHAPTTHSAVQTVDRLDTVDEVAEPEARHKVDKAQKYTEVRPPNGRHHDTLWGIAERTLGDPLRWKEIWELNKERVQPDGRRLTDADLIQPNWQLLLPADAKGPGVHVLHAHDAPTPATGGAHAADAPADITTDAPAPTTDVAAPVTDDQRGGDLGSLLLGGGLILAGVVRALTAQRGPFGAPDDAAADLTAAANARRATFLDQALRSLAENRTAHGQAMPDVRFAYVDDEQVVLHLLGDHDAPARPWSVSADGTSWTLAATELVAPGAGVAAPYPSLVNVATTHGFDVLVDLEMAPGLIALGGHAETARDLATAMALDLVTHGWSDDVDVVMVGFGEHLVDLETGRARQVKSLDEILDDLTAGAASSSATLRQLGVEGVLQGRQRGAVQAAKPLAVFLSGAPTSEQAQALAALTGGGRTAVSVACVGDSPSARWRFTVDAAGGFQATALGLTGQARRLDPGAQRQLRELLAQATASRAAGEDALAHKTPAELAAEALAAAPAEPAGDPADAAVSVRFLGELRVDAPSELSPERRALLTDVVALCALHPDGLHDAVLRSSLWPRGVEQDVVDARIADTQAWLGGATPRLAQGADGRWRLANDLVSDLAVLAAAARQSGAGELDGLLDALRRGTGELFGGDAGTRAWLAFPARQARVLVASAARRTAELAVAAGRIDDASEALRLGVTMVPAAEELWRTLLRLQAHHAPGEVERTITEMYSGLAQRGVRHEPATESLVAELAPGLSRGAGVAGS